MSLNKPAFAWLNGEVVPWDKCVIHARSQTAFWGANVFEGIRVYWQEDNQQMFIYRLTDHLRRLRESMKCIDMPVSYSDEEITQGCLQVIKSNHFREDIHIVIVAGFGFGHNFDSLGYTADTLTHITALPMPRSPRYEQGAHAAITSWRRISDECMPPRIKTGANYHNSRLAQHEVQQNGFDTAIFLNQRGTVAEAPGSCVAMVHKGTLATPPGSSGVLEGITLDSLQRLAQTEFGLCFEKREIDRTEMYLADEVFLCGTLAEIQPVISLDRKKIGCGGAGPITRQLQYSYEKEVRSAPTHHYSLPVYVK
ncbi:aminotransferase class IV [Yersinia alsatica]|uniref:Aminotransferase class IV n=1 Tax=Yersinia alsatica TaxID=2890317 RepID=A0ABY5UM62_9GAMM|nr:aminotransferase class IV [Yersinia alsatica]OWF70611.1 branched-chain amino acid aminotransferase [Yersinia frederiksenii]UWM43855.1 aminotransferase class IV [Yersinia alsatica]CNK77572.1 branched-chain amino acid aminotransferase [Yersinia frederiksenii]CNK78962.1 branched-chain amino acid aminotransferase [Yersinia frederiksenii]